MSVGNLTPGKNQCEWKVFPMFGRQIAALGLSGMLLFSGVVTAANAEEVTPIDFAGLERGGGAGGYAVFG